MTVVLSVVAGILLAGAVVSLVLNIYFWWRLRRLRKLLERDR